jgi:surface antigen
LQRRKRNSVARRFVYSVLDRVVLACACAARFRARQTDGVFTAPTRFLRVATPVRRGSKIMFTFHLFGSRLFSAAACLCFCAACAAPVEAQADPVSADTSTCRFVVGQAEIDGVMQQITGRACLQADGTWQIVEDDAAAQALADGPVYYYDPWYWGPPVVFGVGVSFVFVDRFHHFHHMDHVRYMHGVRGPYGVGGHGGWRGAPPTRSWGGMSHGGGGMRR